ncbi:MAG: low molecular weight protein arginine phosphatase [Candidatus Rokuibacteriota bacterium]
MKTVLFVCHANTCRSVMAQVLLERMLAERDRGRTIRVSSGGVGNTARDGMIPSLDARLVLREAGIHLAETTIVSTDLRQHRDRITDADLILTMTAQQRLVVAALAAPDGRPVFTLREFAGEGGDIGDPMGQDDDVYRACRDEIKRCLELSLDRLLVTLSAGVTQ